MERNSHNIKWIIAIAIYMDSLSNRAIPSYHDNHNLNIYQTNVCVCAVWCIFREYTVQNIGAYFYIIATWKQIQKCWTTSIKDNISQKKKTKREKTTSNYWRWECIWTFLFLPKRKQNKTFLQYWFSAIPFFFACPTPMCCCAYLNIMRQ